MYCEGPKPKLKLGKVLVLVCGGVGVWGCGGYDPGKRPGDMDTDTDTDTGTDTTRGYGVTDGRGRGCGCGCGCGETKTMLLQCIDIIPLIG